MYRNARLRLVTWYAAIFVAILVVLGAAAFVAMKRALDTEARSGVQTVIEQWVSSQPRLGASPLFPNGGDESVFHAETADVFLVAFRPDGSVIANPRNFELSEEELGAAFQSALTGKSTWLTLDVDHARLLALAEPILDDGRIAGVVVGGRSLATHDRSLRQLLAVLGVSGGAGVLLSLAAGWVLAGRAIEPLRQAHERQRAFIADTSHELRSPLAVIRTSADLMLRDTSREADRETLEGVRDVAVEASDLVEEMLELARLSEPAARESADDDEEPPQASLDAEARAVVDQLARLLDAHHSAVTLELQSVRVRARPTEVRRVVRALLENVLAHTPEGTPVHVRSQRRPGRGALIVADGGPGVPDAELDRVFERFSQLSAARTPGRHGAGLGLAIVRAIAERRGGDASAARADGGGLEVTVSLPAA
jgi:two-component system sensor histidine kinase CiaH